MEQFHIEEFIVLREAQQTYKAELGAVLNAHALSVPALQQLLSLTQQYAYFAEALTLDLPEENSDLAVMEEAAQLQEFFRDATAWIELRLREL